MGPSRYGHPEPGDSVRVGQAFLPAAGFPAGADFAEYFDGPDRSLSVAIRKKRSESSASLVMCAVNFMVKPNGQLVTVSSTRHRAYTSVLSNRSSSCALVSLRLGYLILGKVSRLYAFSVYPNRTSLPSDAAGATTGSQEVRPPRSSRTKGRPLQISYAHHR